MITIHHINCGWLHAPPNPRACCHCLLVENSDSRLALIDTGIGLLDVLEPSQRIGQQLIDLAGFQFNESDTARRQIEKIGLDPDRVTDIVLTHADPDHTGGLADFPAAAVHIADEEYLALQAGHWRYLSAHFSHEPRWRRHGPAAQRWFELEARPLNLGFSAELFLIPLPGHTAGHCGVAVQQGDRWVLYVGDAYYLHPELLSDNHPIRPLTEMRADDNAKRVESLNHLRRIARDHAGQVTMFGYHDVLEFPAGHAAVLR